MNLSTIVPIKEAKIERCNCKQFMACFHNCTPISHEELEMEYQRGVEALRIEQAKVRQDESKKPRRKVPKAGCYPSGFSAFTSKRVACTIALSELRRDLFIMTSASDLESIRSGYLNHSKRASEQEVHINTRRNCRQKLTLQDFVCPYSAAEERRQLTKALSTSSLSCFLDKDKPTSHELNLNCKMKCG